MKACRARGWTVNETWFSLPEWEKEITLAYEKRRSSEIKAVLDTLAEERPVEKVDTNAPRNRLTVEALTAIILEDL